jgi:hypothetical protein
VPDRRPSSATAARTSISWPMFKTSFTLKKFLTISKVYHAIESVFQSVRYGKLLRHLAGSLRRTNSGEVGGEVARLPASTRTMGGKFELHQ